MPRKLSFTDPSSGRTIEADWFAAESPTDNDLEQIASQARSQWNLSTSGFAKVPEPGKDPQKGGYSIHGGEEPFMESIYKDYLDPVLAGAKKLDEISGQIRQETVDPAIGLGHEIFGGPAGHRVYQQTLSAGAPGAQSPIPETFSRAFFPRGNQEVTLLDKMVEGPLAQAREIGQVQQTGPLGQDAGLIGQASRAIDATGRPLAAVAGGVATDPVSLAFIEGGLPSKAARALASVFTTRMGISTMEEAAALGEKFRDPKTGQITFAQIKKHLDLDTWEQFMGMLTTGVFAGKGLEQMRPGETPSTAPVEEARPTAPPGQTASETALGAQTDTGIPAPVEAPRVNITGATEEMSPLPTAIMDAASKVAASPHREKVHAKFRSGFKNVSGAQMNVALWAMDKFAARIKDTTGADFYKHLSDLDVRDEASSAEGLPQQKKGTEVAARVFMENGHKVLAAFQSHDFSTVIHETSHLVRQVLGKKDLSLLEGWLGIEDGVWSKLHEEQFARGVEKYFKDGRAPSPELQGVFAKTRQWMHEIYRQIKSGLEGDKQYKDLSPETVAYFDEVFGGPRPKGKRGGKKTPETPREWALEQARGRGLRTFLGGRLVTGSGERVRTPRVKPRTIETVLGELTPEEQDHVAHFIETGETPPSWGTSSPQLLEAINHYDALRKQEALRQEPTPEEQDVAQQSLENAKAWIAKQGERQPYVATPASELEAAAIRGKRRARADNAEFVPPEDIPQTPMMKPRPKLKQPTDVAPRIDIPTNLLQALQKKGITSAKALAMRVAKGEASAIEMVKGILGEDTPFLKKEGLEQRRERKEEPMGMRALEYPPGMPEATHLQHYSRGATPQVAAVVRVHNIMQEAWKKIRAIAAVRLDAPELKKLELSLEETGILGSYRGKRSLAVGEPRENKIVYDPVALAGQSSSPEEFTKELLYTLLHEPAHARGLHAMPWETDVFQTQSDIPENVEYPSHWNRHNDENQYNRAKISSEESRFVNGMEILQHDPAVGAILEKARQALRRQPEIYQGLLHRTMMQDKYRDKVSPELLERPGAGPLEQERRIKQQLAQRDEDRLKNVGWRRATNEDFAAQGESLKADLKERTRQLILKMLDLKKDSAIWIRPEAPKGQEKFDAGSPEDVRARHAHRPNLANPPERASRYYPSQREFSKMDISTARFERDSLQSSMDAYMGAAEEATNIIASRAHLTETGIHGLYRDIDVTPVENWRNHALAERKQLRKFWLAADNRVRELEAAGEKAGSLLGELRGMRLDLEQRRGLKSPTPQSTTDKVINEVIETIKASGVGAIGTSVRNATSGALHVVQSHVTNPVAATLALQRARKFERAGDHEGARDERAAAKRFLYVEKHLAGATVRSMGEAALDVASMISLGKGSKHFADQIDFMKHAGLNELADKLEHFSSTHVKTNKGFIPGALKKGLMVFNILGDRVFNGGYIGAHLGAFMDEIGAKTYPEALKKMSQDPKMKRRFQHYMQEAGGESFKATWQLPFVTGVMRQLGTQIPQSPVLNGLALLTQPFYKAGAANLLMNVTELFPLPAIQKGHLLPSFGEFHMSKRVRNSFKHDALRQQVRLLEGDLVKATDPAEIKLLKQDISQKRLDMHKLERSRIYSIHTAKARAMVGPMLLALATIQRLKRGDDGTEFDQLPGQKDSKGKATTGKYVTGALGEFLFPLFWGDYLGHYLLSQKTGKPFKYGTKEGKSKLLAYVGESLSGSRYGIPAPAQDLLLEAASKLTGGGTMDLEYMKRLTLESFENVGRMAGTMGAPGDIARLQAESKNPEERFSRRTDAPLGEKLTPGAITRGLARGFQSRVPQTLGLPEKATRLALPKAPDWKNLEHGQSIEPVEGALSGLTRTKISPITRFVNAHQGKISMGDILPKRTGDPVYDEIHLQEWVKKVQPLMGLFDHIENWDEDLQISEVESKFRDARADAQAAALRRFKHEEGHPAERAQKKLDRKIDARQIRQRLAAVRRATGPYRPKSVQPSPQPPQTGH